VASVVVVSRKQTHIYILYDYGYKNNEDLKLAVKLVKIKRTAILHSFSKSNTTCKTFCNLHSDVLICF